MTSSVYLERTLSTVLLQAAEQFPAVVVTGPRQSGKTTLVRRHFGATHHYCSLDDPEVRGQAIDDPELLPARFPPPVILDEIQYAPDLLHAVKADIDEHRSARGRFIITGSQVFPLMQGVTESLAGRTAVLSLYSLSIGEARGRPAGDRRWQDVLAGRDGGRGTGSGETLEKVTRAILRGGFPELVANPQLDHRLWHGGYVQTYLERDVRTLRSVGDLNDFQRFLFALAARTGQLVNLADLARDLGVAAKTAKAWVSVLEASGQVMTLWPYHESLGKRLVKRPKVFFLDSGTLAYLLGVTAPEQVTTGIAAGPLFEAVVLGQLFRVLVHRGELLRLYFWRTANGHEVDFVVEAGPVLIPVEARLTATPGRRDAAGIERFQDLFGARAGHGLVVCLCRERHPLTATVDAVPVGAL